MRPERRRILITGLVQGVGFRPAVFRLAHQLQLTGRAANTRQGLVIEIQGTATALNQMIDRIRHSPPGHAVIAQLSVSSLPLIPHEQGFHIVTEDETSAGNTRIMVDLAPCSACLEDIRDPHNHRYQYPFSHCTQCGPRFSLVTALPYKWANTTMAPFTLCERCNHEFNDPDNRRFQAELIACPDCGPQLTFYRDAAVPGVHGHQALQRAVDGIAQGQIIAIKSVGGFQLVCDARNETAIATLRIRKQRPAKPLAVMYPSLEDIRRDCVLTVEEAQLLASPQRPIVLVAAKEKALARNIAPQNPDLGVMLPSSPLHVLLLDQLQHPVVATSGNLSGDSLCYDNTDALERLASIADGFLLHNRDIARPLDDSVVRIMDCKPVQIRRARGYVPAPIRLPPEHNEKTVLALGGHQKNTIAINRGDEVFISPHIGDLDSLNTQNIFHAAVKNTGLFNRENPTHVVHDLHPDYVSTQFARQFSAQHKLTTVPVQHHVAHFFSCMAEHQHTGPALGICWDGNGLGSDGTLWGGEAFTWDGKKGIRRVTSLTAFPLPGGERAIREPRRQALGLLYRFLGASALDHPQIIAIFTPEERHNLLKMLSSNLNTPDCSSIGRLFDAISALLGLVSVQTFEGEAAMALEFSAQQCDTREVFPVQFVADKNLQRIDVKPLLNALLTALARDEDKEKLARMFHNSLVEIMVQTALKTGLPDVFLSGGVFQNKLLVELALVRLQTQGFRTFIHRQVPPNDGGLALGQLYYARCLSNTGETACA